mgnify:CR=1 FL=1
MPFNAAFRRASSIAGGTISTPYTFFAFCARNRETGSDSAVQIPYSLPTGQPRVFQRRSIEFFRLHRIDLIERKRRNLV